MLRPCPANALVRLENSDLLAGVSFDVRPGRTETEPTYRAAVRSYLGMEVIGKETCRIPPRSSRKPQTFCAGEVGTLKGDVWVFWSA